MTDKKHASFMRSLCMGEIEEEIVVPYPEPKASEKETLAAVFQSLKSMLGARDRDFRAWDRAGEMPKSFVDELKEAGLFSLVVPEAHGGLGLGSTAYSRVIQELGRYDASVALTVGAHSSIGMRGLLLFGTDEQRARFLPKLASGELIAAFCLTEPGAGSDAAGIKTTAVRDGDDWVLNGEKLWITNGGIADFFTVFAKTSLDGRGHITAFIVTRDMKGVSTGPHEDKMGIRASSTTTVVLEDVRVPAANVLGEVGKGFKVAMKILNAGRTGLGGGSVGGMKRLIELSIDQARERVQFGQPIASYATHPAEDRPDGDRLLRAGERREPGRGARRPRLRGLRGRGGDLEGARRPRRCGAPPTRRSRSRAARATCARCRTSACCATPASTGSSRAPTRSCACSSRSPR